MTKHAPLGEVDKNAVARYNNARQEYQEVVEFYKSARRDYLNAKDKYVQTKNNADLKTTLDEAKQFLIAICV